MTCHPTVGARLLRAWMEQQRFDLRRVASLLDVHASYVSHLRVGRRTPSLELAFILERVSASSVPAVSWCEAA